MPCLIDYARAHQRVDQRQESPLGRRRILLYSLILLVSFAITLGGASAQVPVVPTSAPGALVGSAQYLRTDRLGITFISFIDGNMGAERYRNALILGAGWNRWPLYWDRVETQPRNYDWSAYDQLVTTDLANGLKINAILLGRPGFWQDGNSIANLFTPIYADGTDSADSDKPINPNNPWAQFVHYAVTPATSRVVLWRSTILSPPTKAFTSGRYGMSRISRISGVAAPRAYARLLKVAAVVIKTVDPEATVMFGGLLIAGEPLFLSHVLSAFQNDALRHRYNWFFDAVALHSYDDPWRSGWLTKFVQDTLLRYDLARPIWVNETGVSVWNDYPGPVWANSPEQRNRLATAEQQAHFLIMSAAFAWSKGVDKIFFHQLYGRLRQLPRRHGLSAA